MKLKCKIFSFQFCSLTEEQRQEEVVVAMKEENQNLQQVNLSKASTETSGVCCFTGLVLGLVAFGI